jgi:hypothetical protein
MSELAEQYISDDGRRIVVPTYEALAKCQIILASAETGQVGPTVVEPGEHFSTEAVPCHQWKPLNAAADERFNQWLDSLPLDGAKNVTLEHITEAARMLAPRAGDPEFSHQEWSKQVAALATKLAEKRRTELKPSVGFRPMAPNAPPMPFAAMSPSYPMETGRAPAAQQVAPGAPRRTAPGKPKPAMPGANVTDTPASAAG